MATQVNTWTEFVTAFRASDVSEIEIMSDLDANDSLPTAMISAGCGKTINGNYHTIWNISTGQVVSGAILNAYGNWNMVWNKINFNNISRNENYPVFRSYSSSRVMQFYDCTFVGKGYRLTDYAEYTRCAVTWSGTTYPNVFIGNVFFYSWIHLDVSGLSNNLSGIIARIDTCYVEGKFEGSDAITVSALIPTASNSVINVETNVGGLVTSGYTLINVYNKDKAPNVTAHNNSSIAVTDAQLKDAAYLASIGFNINV